MKTRWPIWAVAPTLLVLGACPKRPFSFGPRGEITDPHEALEALASRSAKLHRLSSELSVTAHGDRGSGSTRGLVAAERPARLRLELDDFFGNPAGVLTTDGTLLGIFEAASNVYATGRATPENFARAMPVELPVSEAVDVLLGDPRPLDVTVRGFFVDRDRYAYSLLFASGEGARGRRQRIDLDSQTLVPVGETVEGLDPFVARFSDFESESGLRVPRRIEVESPGGNATLKYRGLEINPAIPVEMFAPRAPPGATPKLLE